MASINDIKQSKFLKKEDVGDGVLVTIHSVQQMNIAKEGADEELKWTVSFVELEKPMVLNSTNAQVIAKITGFENDIEINWKGKVVVLYDDPNVSYAGKITGGIRVRAARKQAEEKALPF